MWLEEGKERWAPWWHFSVSGGGLFRMGQRITFFTVWHSGQDMLQDRQVNWTRSRVLHPLYTVQFKKYFHINYVVLATALVGSQGEYQGPLLAKTR